jgi:hypothetical protein
MGGACGTYGEKKVAWRILLYKPEGKRDYVEDLDVDISVISKTISKQSDGCLNCFELVRIQTRGEIL